MGVVQIKVLIFCIVYFITVVSDEWMVMLSSFISNGIMTISIVSSAVCLRDLAVKRHVIVRPAFSICISIEQLISVINNK
jgi:hypothetical protein